MSILKHKILCLFLVILFDNRDILCFGFSDIAAALFPLYTPFIKGHSEKTEKYYHTGVLLFTGSFSGKVAYKKDIEKVPRNRSS